MVGRGHKKCLELSVLWGGVLSSVAFFVVFWKQKLQLLFVCCVSWIVSCWHLGVEKGAKSVWADPLGTTCQYESCGSQQGGCQSGLFETRRDMGDGIATNCPSLRRVDQKKGRWEKRLRLGNWRLKNKKRNQSRQKRSLHLLAFLRGVFTSIYQYLLWPQIE